MAGRPGSEPVQVADPFPASSHEASATAFAVRRVTRRPEPAEPTLESGWFQAMTHVPRRPGELEERQAWNPRKGNGGLFALVSAGIVAAVVAVTVLWVGPAARNIPAPAVEPARAAAPSPPSTTEAPLAVPTTMRAADLPAATPAAPAAAAVPQPVPARVNPPARAAVAPRSTRHPVPVAAHAPNAETPPPSPGVAPEPASAAAEAVVTEPTPAPSASPVEPPVEQGQVER